MAGGFMALLATFFALPASAAEATVHSSSVGQVNESQESEDGNSHAVMSYYAIFYGPSVQDPSLLQPNERGEQSADRPLLLKNYLTLGYDFNREVEMSATAYGTLVPVAGHSAVLHDPYLRIAFNSIAHTDKINLYGDVRLHLPTSTDSKNADLRSGIQLFQITSMIPSDSRFGFGIYTSERVNFYGPAGNGSDLVLYVGPNISYQVSNSIALTTLYEMGASHTYGDETWGLNNDGTDLEPGVSWDITPNLNVNPYLNIYTGNQVTLQSTSIGMTLSWKML